MSPHDGSASPVASKKLFVVEATGPTGLRVDARHHRRATNKRADQKWFMAETVGQVAQGGGQFTVVGGRFTDKRTGKAMSGSGRDPKLRVVALPTRKPTNVVLNGRRGCWPP